MNFHGRMVLIAGAILSFMEKSQFENLFTDSESKLKNSLNKGSFGTLLKEVVNTGKCIECGACVGVCNYNALSWNSELGKPVLSGKCVACGVCYHQCPKSDCEFSEIIGKFTAAFQTKAINLVGGQDGTTVTAILTYMLKNSLISAAIVTTKKALNDWSPVVLIATSEQDLKQAKGSIYAHSQTLSALFEAIKKGHKKIAFVGTPCNSECIAKMISRKEGVFADASGLEIYNIGLFCMEAFIPSKLKTIIENKEINYSSIAKMGFEGGSFVLRDATYEKLGALSIKSLHEAVESSCKVCPDFSAEYADISVGNIGTPDGYNSVIVRSEKMKTILMEMKEKGLLDVKEMDIEGVKQIVKSTLNKRANMEKLPIVQVEQSADKFNKYKPQEWNVNQFNYEPELHPEFYQRIQYSESTINSGKPNSDPVIVAKTPNGTKADFTKHNYASAYDLTLKIFQSKPKIKGARVLIKPNNTGFIGCFKNPQLSEVLKQNGITDDADHQPIATQPSMLKGAVDALLDLGVKEIHIGENMLWDGGTPRAFFETGYAQIFSDKKYAGKVYFIDFYENDPPAERLKEIEMEKTKYCKTDYYNHFYPPAAIFNEKYDYIYLVAIAKVHNCAYYTLSAKGFSISMNPRKKTGKIEPRWQIHGLPLSLFNKETIKDLLGEDFKRQYKYYVREVYRHQWEKTDKSRVVKPNKSDIIISNEESSSGLIHQFKSFGQRVLNVDPHHWAGVNNVILNLGMGYLINRFTRVFGTMVKKMKENGTEVAALISGIVGQEGDGPLVYGNTKYGGFSVASFDHVALERVCLEIMFSTDTTGFKGFLFNRQKQKMEKDHIDCPELLEETKNEWTLKILHDLLGGNFETKDIPIHVLNYDGDKSLNTIQPNELFKLRLGAPFKDSIGYYCNPDLWIKLMHTNESIYRNAFKVEKGSITIPLIPGVV